MGLRWIALALLGLAAPARGDTSLEAGAKPSGSGWSATCTVALERARDDLARIDPRFSGGTVSAEADPAYEADDCDQAAPLTVRLESQRGAPVSYMAEALTNQNFDRVEPWRRTDDGWSRHDHWRAGLVTIDRSRELAQGVLRHAVDACLATLPSLAPSPATPPPRGLTDAEHVAWRLERMCRVQLGRGLTGGPGRTVEFLRPILALGDKATPILLRLARSRNAAARATAAFAMGQLPRAAHREALARLSLDETVVETQLGCTGMGLPVASFAREALAQRKVPNQDRR